MNVIRRPWPSFLAVFFFACSLCLSTSGQAIENRFLTADTLSPGKLSAGAAVSITDDFIFAYPALRYGAADGIEIGGKIGLVDSDVPHRKDTGIHLGVDAKLRLWNDVPRLPADLALDIGYSFSGVAGRTLHEWNLTPLVSKRIDIPQAIVQAVPYAGIEVLGINGSLLSDNVHAFGIIGADWRFTDRLSAQTEIKFGDRTIGGVGIRMTF